MNRSHIVIALSGWCVFGISVLPRYEQAAIAEAGQLPPPVAAAVGVGCTADIEPPGGDCQVNVTDLLALLSQWGACNIAPDSAEPNDTCPSVHTLAAVGSTVGDQTQEWAASTLSAGDIDLFVFDANETDASCSCCDLFCLDEDYLVTVTLAVPATATGSYVFRVDEACTTSTAGALAVAPGLSESISFWVDGDCTGPQDSYTRFILVAGIDGTVSSCDSYTLTYTFIPGCQ